jgi:hypothetical protein
LDSGAQRSFIAAAYAKKLGLKPIRKEKVAITGFDRKTSRFDANIYKLKLASEETIEVEVIEIDQVVGRLTRLEDSTTMEELKQPLLPARKFSCVEPDLLLGMDEFADIVQQQVTKLASGFAMYQTKLGPIVCGRGRVDGVPKGVIASSMIVSHKESSITLASPMLWMAGMSSPIFASMVQATLPDNSSHNCLEDNLVDCASKEVEEPNLLRGFEEGKKEAQSNRKNTVANPEPNIRQPKKALSNVNNRSRSVQACPLPVLGKRHQITKGMETNNSANTNEATPANVRRKTFRRREYFAISRCREDPPASKYPGEHRQ